MDFCASHPMVTPDHLQSVGSVLVGAAPVGNAVIEKFMKKAPHCKIKEGKAIVVVYSHAQKYSLA